MWPKENIYLYTKKKEKIFYRLSLIQQCLLLLEQDVGRSSKNFVNSNVNLKEYFNKEVCKMKWMKILVSGVGSLDIAGQVIKSESAQVFELNWVRVWFKTLIVT